MDAIAKGEPNTTEEKIETESGSTARLERYESGQLVIDMTPVGDDPMDVFAEMYCDDGTLVRYKSGQETRDAWDHITTELENYKA